MANEDLKIIQSILALRGLSIVFFLDFFEENYYIGMAGVMTLLMYHKKVFFEKKKFPLPLKSRAYFGKVTPGRVITRRFIEGPHWNENEDVFIRSS